MHVESALDAEQWASDLIGTWRAEAPSREAWQTVLLPSFVRALEALGTTHALASLRALSAVGAAGAAEAANRLAAAAGGLSEPAWGDDLGRWQQVAATLMSEPAFDDGVNVMVEFADPGGALHTLGVYIDHNLGGLVKDVFLAERLVDVRATIESAPDRDRVAWRELGLDEARARIEAALDILDHTLGAPVHDEVSSLRALVEARLRLLPSGFELPDSYVEVPREERDVLLADFLASAEGARWRGDEDAEFVARLAIDFGADYNHGGALRWSPVVVELFMLDWLGRKVAEEPEFFERVPEVLAAWVGYAGRRRGVPKQSLDEAVAAVGQFRGEMLETVGDPESWAPAKMFFAAATQAGVDVSDREAVDRFVRHYNEGLPTQA